MMTRITTLDLPAFRRATIGFDSLFNEMESRLQVNQGGYPPYNIVQLNDNEFVISVAVAGFSMKNLNVTQDKNVLHVEGTAPDSEAEVNYLHKGIGGRSFRREFALAEHVYVKSAGLENGLLNIHLVREVPEELKPKTIKIVEGNTVTIESK